LLYHIFSKSASHCKATAKKTAKKTAKVSNATLSMFSLFLFLFFCSFAVIEICIQKMGCWGRVRWGGSVGLNGIVFAEDCKTAKNFTKCLIFNDLLFCSGFAVALQWLCNVRKTLDFQRFANIKQVLVSQRFCSAGGSRVRDKVAWFGVLYGAKQRC
jgi:hypothetical protein